MTRTIELPPIHICVTSAGAIGDCPFDAKPIEDFQPGYVYNPNSAKACQNPAMVEIDGVCTPPEKVPPASLVPGNRTDAQVIASALVTSYAPDLGIYGSGYDITRAGAFRQLFKADTAVIEQLKQATVGQIRISQANLALIRQILGKAIAGGVSNEIAKYRALELQEIERLKARRELILAFRRVLILKYNGIVPSEDLLRDLNQKNLNLQSLNRSGLGVPPALLALAPFLKILGYGLAGGASLYLLMKAASVGITNIQDALNTELRLIEAQNNQLDTHNKCLDHAIRAKTANPAGLGLTIDAAFKKCAHLENIDADAFRKAADKANFMNVLKDMSVYIILGVGLYVGTPFLKELVSSKTKQLAGDKKE